MEIRMLNQQEVLPALRLTWEVFAADVAPLYPPEGVAQFQKFIKYNYFNGLYQRQELYMFGAFEGLQMCGTLAVKGDGHICLFFVKKSYQGRGIGKMLFQSACKYCVQQLRVSKITVNAAPNAVTQFLHMGMRQTGAEQVMNGICYVPMEMYVSPEVQPVKARKRTSLMIAAVIAGVIFLGVIVFGGGYLVKSLYETVTEHRRYDWQEEPDEDYFYGDDIWDDGEDGIYEELTGIDAIPAKISDSLSYELKDESYTYTDDEKQTTYINFYVQYPQLKGLAGAAEEKINEEIKTCAMDTVEKIYNNPSDEVKERVMRANPAALVSYVKYKVCYANDEFISIVFEDYSYQGNLEEFHQNLRTMNIGLKDGIVYEVKDIVKLDDAFINEWLAGMRDETQNTAFLSEIGMEDYKKTLGGDSLDGVYVANFFVDAHGIEIGYNLNYQADDSHDLGYLWVTAPFAFDEIEKYASDSEFWKLLR